jgi:hypothetical protein
MAGLLAGCEAATSAAASTCGVPFLWTHGWPPVSSNCAKNLWGLNRSETLQLSRRGETKTVRRVQLIGPIDCDFVLIFRS